MNVVLKQRVWNIVPDPLGIIEPIIKNIVTLAMLLLVLVGRIKVYSGHP